MPIPCIVAFCKKNGSHIFPKDEPRRTKWIEAIEHKKPGLTLRKHSRICSDHFKPTDFRRTPLALLQPDSIQRTLNKTAIPSIFPWKSAQQSTPDEDLPVSRPISTYARIPPTMFVEVQPYLSTVESDFDVDPLNLTNEDSDNNEQIAPNVDIEESIAEDLQLNLTNKESDCNEQIAPNVDIEESIAEELEISSLEVGDGLQEQLTDGIEKHEISVQTEEYYSCGFSIHHYKKNHKAIHFYTGLENFNKVMLVFNTLGPCAHTLNYFYGKPPANLDALEQFFITLIILRRHKPFEEIAMMYNVRIKQIYNIFITWIRFMSLQWKNLDLWLDRESVKVFMPLDFYDKYPLTRVVLDATEFPIKKPKLPFAQQVTFSSYKNRNTVKVLIGITPSGMISYVSSCYGGSATDRQIIERSSILRRFNYNDEIMVDKGLNVQDIFISYGVRVNMPSFFKRGNQIGSQTLSSNRKVASKRVHIERVIGMLKTYKILCHPMNQTETMLSSDIVYICAMLVNFRSSIVNKDA